MSRGSFDCTGEATNNINKEAGSKPFFSRNVQLSLLLSGHMLCTRQKLSLFRSIITLTVKGCFFSSNISRERFESLQQGINNYLIKTFNVLM